jgi:hypothetical protein
MAGSGLGATEGRRCSPSPETLTLCPDRVRFLAHILGEVSLTLPLPDSPSTCGIAGTLGLILKSLLDDPCFLSKKRRKPLSSKTTFKPELYHLWSQRDFGDPETAGAQSYLFTSTCFLAWVPSPCSILKN